jgi:predicted DNA-binding transcriptional regulator YafY
MERGEVRTYRVDRIGSLRALEKSSEVELELKQGRSGSPTPGYGDPSLPEVVIALTRRGAMEADRSFPETPVRHEPEGPRIRVRCPPREYHWFARAVLGMGGEATAVEPAPFVSLVRRLAADVAVRHGGPPESPALGNKSAADRKGGSDMNLDGDMRPGSASG